MFAFHLPSPERRRAILSAALLLLTCVSALAGPTLSAVNVTDAMMNAQGGLARGTRLLDKLDLTATWLGDDRGWTGLSLFADIQVTSAAGLTDNLVGDAQGVSSIDAPAGVRLANAWAAREFDGFGGLKAGVIDLNSEFDVQATGALFLNSAFGIGPDFSQIGANGPSIFPSTGLGLTGWWLPGEHWQVKAGLFEGTPGDPLHPGRTSFALGASEGALLVLEVRNQITPNFVLGAGAWRHTATFDAIDPLAGRINGNSGFYAIADGLLWSPPKAQEDDGTGLAGWLRVGFADDRINAIETAIGGGLVYTGLFGRDSDQAGFAVTHIRFGAPTRQADLADSSETAFELTYSLSLGDHFTLQPDLQYVISPGGNPAIDNALVVGSRITATW